MTQTKQSEKYRAALRQLVNAVLNYNKQARLLVRVRQIEGYEELVQLATKLKEEFEL